MRKLLPTISIHKASMYIRIENIFITHKNIQQNNYVRCMDHARWRSARALIASYIRGQAARGFRRKPYTWRTRKTFSNETRRPSYESMLCNYTSHVTLKPVNSEWKGINSICKAMKRGKNKVRFIDKCRKTRMRTIRAQMKKIIK
jgi:hypothetical protein